MNIELIKGTGGRQTDWRHAETQTGSRTDTLKADKETWGKHGDIGILRREGERESVGKYTVGGERKRGKEDVVMNIQ